MLPSTGYFKGINCPFYDSGLCERPYCHFRHVKKESQCLSNEGIESGTILQQLVSEAVKKVLQQSEASTSPKSVQITNNDASSNSEISQNPPPLKVTYNPTPISELKKITTTDAENDENEQRKRHIPVPYTPRKPASLPIKRPIDTNGDSKLYIPPPVKYLPGCTEGVILDPYTPVGGIESKEKYLPGTEAELQEYKPAETESSNKHNYVPSDKSGSKKYLPGTEPELQEYKIAETKSFNKHNYVPSDKSVSKKKVLEYKPTKVKTKSDTPIVTYQPTPRSQVPCFSSDEDEPNTKKRKLSTDLNGLDDLGAEFDMLGEILDEEDDTKEIKSTCKEVITSNESKQINNHIEHNKNGKSTSEKHEKRKSEHKEKDKKEKSTKGKEKHDSKSKSSNKKSSHKSSSKEKDRDRDKESKNRDKHKESKDQDKIKESKEKDKEKEKKREKDTEKKRHSSSKGTDKTSKSTDKSSKSLEKHPKHSSSSKTESRQKEKSGDRKSSHKSSKEKSRSKDNRKEERHKEKHQKVIHNLSDNDDFDDRTNLSDELCEEVSESDEEAIALECKRIFEEYVPTEKPKILEELPSKNDDNPDEYIPTKKRISRTVDKNIKVLPKEPMKPDYKVSAAQKMAERLAKVREYHASKLAASTIENSTINTDLQTAKSAFNTPSSSGKIRIAHVPYASYLMNAKKSISTKPDAAKTEPSTSTITQTVKKGTTRVAHMPSEKFIDRPGVLEPLASKIPANIRSTYLNMMIDECIKIYLSATDAYARAQHEELATSKKCKTIQIYKNSAVLTVSRLRKELAECNGVKKSGSDCTTLQWIPGAISGTSTNSNAGSWSIENKSKRAGDTSHEFRGSKFYENISKWILTEEQLQDNGFPRPHPSEDKGRAMIYAQNNKQKPPKGIYRTCVRCKKEYTVDKKGIPAIKEECIYHPNNKYRVRGEVKYQCCSQDGMSDGCCVAPNHVYEYVDYENLKGYVRTMPPDIEKDDYGVYSLDCEMCYTTQGLDLTRITVINSTCKVVYETLIRPLHPIIDYNTRYSGITEEQMADVRTTPLEVQATLLSMFNSKTILIGHSLESDFKALKLIHDTVIDTSVLFPHKMGPPYKRALRNLSSEYLKKIIQNSVDGHDSAEDASVCMELIHFKLKEDLKTR